MKKHLVTGMVTAALLVTGFAGGYVVNEATSTTTSTIEAQTKELQSMMKQNAMLLQKDQAARKAITQTEARMIRENAEKLEAQAGSEAIVQVPFQITENTGEYVRGELIPTAGEGVYFTKEEAASFDLENVKPGTIVNVGWSESDYAEENWGEIATAHIDGEE